MTNSALARRIEYLDAVRGIAAMMVVVYHFIGWRWGDYTKYHAASLIFNGSDAVSFFFVLSGLVLSYKYFHFDAELKLKKYTIKRIIRLYPAFMVTVLINYLYWNRGLIMEMEWLSILKDMFLENRKGLWQELVMVRNAHKYYIPGWTMGVEMAISLLMPIFIILARKEIKYIWFMLFVSLFIGKYMSMFVFHFLLGTLISYYFSDIKNYHWKESKWYKWRIPLLLLTFILFSVRHLDRILDFPSGYHHVANMLSIDFFHFTGLASAVIIIFIIKTPWLQNLLKREPWQFLGKISYSIYLMHWIFVVYIMDHWDQLIAKFPSFTAGFSALLALYILITLLGASLLFYTVEKPFMKWKPKFLEKM